METRAKRDGLTSIYMDIKNSTDIASATLELYVENLDDDFDLNVLFGILGQLEIVKSKFDDFNLTMCGGVA